MKSVLVVDDSLAFSAMLQKALMMRGEIKVELAKNGMEGLNILKQITPSLIMLDIEMPVMNGIQFLEVIRKEEQYKNLPVIIMSANKNTEIIKQAVNLGVSEYILKPASIQTILEKVNRVII
ncbi:MAG TPA: response regulator [Melioribacteraceae bacterium]|nr:response regulator [Melioribacteraceae bacterium]